MKKRIGFIALGVGILDLFTLMILMLSDNVLGDGGFTSVGAFCFVLWFACVITAIFCLAETFIQFIGKNLNQNRSFTFNADIKKDDAVLCPHCGKYHAESTTFCPHCGEKQ